MRARWRKMAKTPKMKPISNRAATGKTRTRGSSLRSNPTTKAVPDWVRWTQTRLVQVVAAGVMQIPVKNRSASPGTTAVPTISPRKGREPRSEARKRRKPQTRSRRRRKRAAAAAAISISISKLKARIAIVLQRRDQATGKMLQMSEPNFSPTQKLATKRATERTTATATAKSIRTETAKGKVKAKCQSRKSENARVSRFPQMDKCRRITMLIPRRKGHPQASQRKFKRMDSIPTGSS
mmetsp:Transcript_14942/g.42230  ORF Transcript_14942/g.42230 Transcript_14942/m.42230 type:complete len:238 (-) Transcript_14942:1027-1740(-)